MNRHEGHGHGNHGRHEVRHCEVREVNRYEGHGHGNHGRHEVHHCEERGLRVDGRRVDDHHAGHGLHEDGRRVDDHHDDRVRRRSRLRHRMTCRRLNGHGLRRRRMNGRHLNVSDRDHDRLRHCDLRRHRDALRLMASL